jgi:Family of unknown function (DUF6496)
MAKKRMTKAQTKVRKVLHEFKTGTLHSGSKTGPVVTSRKRAIAIALDEAGLARKKRRRGKSRSK